MRLDAGGTRELHWHLAAEWGYMTYGECRVTCIDPQGRAYAADVRAGDLWYFPGGYPHALQGIGSDGCEFILAFDDGKATEFNTLLVTDWFAHTPPDVLAANFGLPESAFSKNFTHSLWIYQGQVPGPLAADQQAIASDKGAPPNPFTYSLASGPISKRTRGGFVQVADSHNFKASSTIAAALVTVHPGGLREMHWHPNADEWQYWIAGRGQMTVFGAGPKAVTNNFAPGDIGYVKRSFGHYIKNVGDEDLVFLEVFKTPTFQDVSLSDWLAHSPPRDGGRALQHVARGHREIPQGRAGRSAGLGGKDYPRCRGLHHLARSSSIGNLAPRLIQGRTSCAPYVRRKRRRGRWQPGLRASSRSHIPRRHVRLYRSGHIHAQTGRAGFHRLAHCGGQSPAAAFSSRAARC